MSISEASVRSDNSTRVTQEVWEAFATAETDREFYGAWLSLQCHRLALVKTAALMLGPADTGPFVPEAVWPDMQRRIQHFSAVAEKALGERRGLVLDHEGSRGEKRHHIAYPIEIRQKIYGLVILEVGETDKKTLRDIMRQLYWGSAWLVTRILRACEATTETLPADPSVLSLVACALEQEGFYASALALATELATQLPCDRVSIGFIEKHHIKVVAISHSAEFGHKANLVNAIGCAMDEALDQYSTVHYTAEAEVGEAVVKRSHQALAQLSSAASVSTIPLVRMGSMVGALTFEKITGSALSKDCVVLCEAVAAMAGPILYEKRQNDRPLYKKILGVGREQLGKLTGPRHVLSKLLVGSFALLCVFFLWATGDYRVSAKTVIEGRVQRAITAPFSGYIMESKSRHGDVVEKDQVLAILDDRDLQLERLKAEGREQQLQREYREAMAEHNKAQVRIIAAQLSQIEADLELYDYQLARTQLVSPFAGVVVSGDLSQSLDAPVDKGQVLYEVAPLQSYRVILQVDERDIQQVQSGQSGRLALSGLPGQKLSFEVKKITPVSIANEGRNYFRVEAELDSDTHMLRPGMEGVGKIDIERRKLIWIWTHRLFEWLELWIWTWWP